MVKKHFAALYALFANRAYCAHRLTISVCLGVYIAFCPLVGLHTAMVFFLGWLFSLHTPVLLAVSMLINNPWTMIGIYGLDHWIGKEVCNFFVIDHALFAPEVLQSWNQWLFSYLHMPDFSLGAFLLGGNVLGVTCAVIAYPIVNYGVIRYIRLKEHLSKQKENKSTDCAGSNENNSAE